MKQMKTYTKSDFHNPEQLTRQQVGTDYRLLLPEEVDGRFGWHREKIAFVYIGLSEWSMEASLADYHGNTYRVPLATPLPDGTVLSSNECCWSDAPAKPRLYLAGGMSGYVDYNFPAFFKAAAELEKQGYEAINPAQLDIDAGYTLEKLKQLSPAEHQEFLKDAVKRDLDAIQTCQAIAMLPGWENSKGAKAELAVAQWLGLDEVYLDDTKTPYGSKKPDADGWIPHVSGDPMPCDGTLRVEVKFVCGIASKKPELAELFDWDWNGKSYAISAWRPAQPKQPYNSDERAEWKATASPMDEYLCSKERIADCGKIDMGDYSSTATSPLVGKYLFECEGVEDAPFENFYASNITPPAYAPGNSSYVDRDSRGQVIGSGYAPDDPKGAAGAKKAPMHLLPPDALIEIAKVMGEGARKYQPWNFIAARVCASTYIGAILRHWAEFAKGRDIDDGVGGSGLSHLSHIAANCMILLTAKQQGTLNDDRPKLK